MNNLTQCSVVMLLLAALAGDAAVWAQSAPPVKGMASTVGLFVYPRNKQPAQQQLTDESQCYQAAERQTGYNPNATTTAGKTTKPQDQKSGDKPLAQGAMRGAVIAGATGGDPAAGARRGAILGGIKAKRKDKQETAQQKQAAAAANAQQQSVDSFKRSMSACLDARGYSVK